MNMSRARSLLFAILLVAGAPHLLGAQETSRFRPIHVYVDTGTVPLATYQLEITAPPGAKIVGVEGGDHTAFSAAPYYDPAALAGDRIIIAAFSTGTNLPRNRTRVATLHMQETQQATPYVAKLIVAASIDGKPIDATVLLEPH